MSYDEFVKYAVGSRSFFPPLNDELYIVDNQFSRVLQWLP